MSVWKGVKIRVKVMEIKIAEINASLNINIVENNAQHNISAT